MAFEIWTLKQQGSGITQNKKKWLLVFHLLKKKDKVCEWCIYEKMHRLPFLKTTWRAKTPLQLVRADTCGPTRTP